MSFESILILAIFPWSKRRFNFGHKVKLKRNLSQGVCHGSHGYTGLPHARIGAMVSYHEKSQDKKEKH